MPRRGENIRKRSDGRWEARYIKYYDRNGKAKYGSVYGKTYTQVKQKRTQVLKEADADDLHGRAKNMLFSHIVYKWLESRRIKIKEQTYAKYRSVINLHIAPAIGDIKIEKVNIDFINEILYDKSRSGKSGCDGLSYSSLYSIVFILKSSLKYAAQNGWCRPLGGEIRMPVKLNRAPEALTLKEQSMIEDHCLALKDGRAIGVLLSLYTGLRIGEVCGLRWEDVNVDTKTLHVRRTVQRISSVNDSECESKTKLVLSTAKSTSSDRIIPIPSKIMPLLICGGEGFIIKGRNHDYADPRTMQYYFSRMLKSCKIRHVNYHTLRHTFATRCVESGMDIKSLSEILGHANINVTLSIYVHSSMDHKRKQMEAMASICGK